MNVTEGGKEGPQGFLGNQRRQPTDKDRRIVRVCGRKLLAIGSYEIAQYCAGLRLMLP